MDRDGESVETAAGGIAAAVTAVALSLAATSPVLLSCSERLHALASNANAITSDPPPTRARLA